MKKYILNIAAVVVSLLGISACNDDFLEKTPIGELSEASSFTTFETCTAYEKNLYGIFEGYSFVPGQLIIKNSLGSSTRDSYSSLLFDISSYKNFGIVPGVYASATKATTTSDDAYSVPYEYIRMANIMLAHIDEPDVTDEQRTYLEAVARFFRAFCHYALFINFGDIIYVDEVLTETSETLTCARESRISVADKIYEELLWVATNIPDAVAERNTINSDVAKTMLSRFALFEATWRKYHNVAETGAKYTKETMLAKVVEIGQELSQKYPSLYQGDGTDSFAGAGWGQMWTTDDLSSVSTVFLFDKFIPDYKCHLIGHHQHTSSAKMNLPQSTVNLYLTEDGLPIHNANVKTYDYADGVYTERAENYDYAKCDPYLTFRKRDRRLWQTAVPPFRVKQVSVTSTTNNYARIEGFGNKYNEYIDQMTVLGTEATDEKVGTYYNIPYFNEGWHLQEGHKALPTANWAGNLMIGHPSLTNLCAKVKTVSGQTCYHGDKSYQTSYSYMYWKDYCIWDRSYNKETLNIADKPIFKIEEVLLNYAEAAWELGQFDQSIADVTINRLRDRAAVGRMNVADINSSFDPDRDQTVDPVLWEIRRERLIELLGEGFSFEDVRRWKKGEWYVNQQLYGPWVDKEQMGQMSKKTGGETGLLDLATHQEGTKAAIEAQNGGNVYFYMDPVTAGKGWQDRYYLEPIPTEELLLNDKLVQNPDWE